MFVVRADEQLGGVEVRGDAEGVPDDVQDGEGERDRGLAPALLPRGEQCARAAAAPRCARSTRTALLQRRDPPGPAARGGCLDRQHRQLRHPARGQYTYYSTCPLIPLFLCRAAK